MSCKNNMIIMQSDLAHQIIETLNLASYAPHSGRCRVYQYGSDEDQCDCESGEIRKLSREYERILIDLQFSAEAERNVATALEDASTTNFKNFHLRLCERFGYSHDEVHWRRDLVSLEEFIASKMLATKVSVMPPSVEEALTYARQALVRLGNDIYGEEQTDWATLAIERIDAALACSSCTDAAGLFR